ncbi:hypothetical protein BDF14DRAFT_1812644 [Spinellus fusiger]|nr:hypothetical protein BDF14DRAFT_1812644 [Spinellus fusiger]
MKTPTITCFWSLISLHQLEFIYVPRSVGDVEVAYGKLIKDLLLHRSILEFMHQDEVDQARNDLSGFTCMKTLAGSVTRCRIRPLETIARFSYQYETGSESKSSLNSQFNTTQKLNIDQGEDTEWDVVDIVMYTISEDVILTFFHRSEHNNSICGEISFDVQDIQKAVKMLNSYTEKNLHESSLQEQSWKDPVRIFQIHDSVNNQLIASWPSLSDVHRESAFSRHPRHPNATYAEHNTYVPQLINKVTELTRIATSRNMSGISGDHRQGVDEIACTHHFHSSSMVHLDSHGMLRFERIIIPYGLIVFGSYDITRIQRVSTNDIGNYYHYMHCNPSTLFDDSGNTHGPSRSPKPDLMNTHPSAYKTIHQPPMDISSPTVNTMNIPQILSINNVPTAETTAPNFATTTATTPTTAAGAGGAADFPDNSSTSPTPTLAYLKLHSLSHSGRYPFTSDSSAPTAPPPLAYPNALLSPETSPIPRASSSGSTLEQRRWLYVRPIYESQNARQAKKVCERCKTNSSPEWRRGPSGHKTLCNACGLRYSRLLSKQWIKVEQKKPGSEAVKGSQGESKNKDKEEYQVDIG